MFRPSASEAVVLGECAAREGIARNTERTFARLAPTATGLLIPELQAPSSIEREDGAWVAPCLAELRAAKLLTPADETEAKDEFELLDVALNKIVCPSLKHYDDCWNYVHCHQFTDVRTMFNIIVHPVMEEAFPLERLFRKLGPELMRWAVFVINEHPFIAGPSVWDWWLDDYGLRPKKTDSGEEQDYYSREWEPDPEAKTYLAKLKRRGFESKPVRPMADETALRRIRRRDRKLADIFEALTYRAKKADPWKPCKFTEPIAVTFFKYGDPTQHAIDAIAHDLAEGAMSFSNDVAVFEGTILELKRQMEVAERWLGPVFALQRWCQKKG